MYIDKDEQNEYYMKGIRHTVIALMTISFIVGMIFGSLIHDWLYNHAH